MSDFVLFRALRKSTNQPLTGWIYKLTEVLETIKTAVRNGVAEDDLCIERWEGREVTND